MKTTFRRTPAAAAILGALIVPSGAAMIQAGFNGGAVAVTHAMPYVPPTPTPTPTPPPAPYIDAGFYGSRSIAVQGWNFTPGGAVLLTPRNVRTVASSSGTFLAYLPISSSWCPAHPYGQIFVAAYDQATGREADAEVDCGPF